MGERKVLNKYFPSDFDPAVLEANKKKLGGKQVKIRAMLPFTAQCTDCGNFLYRGTKFNARKEEAKKHRYLNIAVYRFYIKCTACSNEVVFRTDPKNSDYVCEAGANRNYEPWRQAQLAENFKKILKDDAPDVMEQLENRQEESKKEMDELEKLEMLKKINSENANLTPDDAIEYHRKFYEGNKDDNVEEAEKQFKKLVRRIDDHDDDDDHEGAHINSSNNNKNNNQLFLNQNHLKKKSQSSVENIVVVKKRKKLRKDKKKKKKVKKQKVDINPLVAYGDSSDSN